MGSVRRPEFDRALVHAYTRGNNRMPVYFDEFDYTAWLRLLAAAVERFGWRCHAYCLMPNHYHLLLEGSQRALSHGMRYLNGSFAQRINCRYDRTGHVFEGPYRQELIVEQPHLLEVCRYVPLNPVRAGLCARAEEWPWSSFRATAGVEHRPPWLTVAFVRSLFGRGSMAVERYRAFVADGAMLRSDMATDQVAGHVWESHVS